MKRFLSVPFIFSVSLALSASVHQTSAATIAIFKTPTISLTWIYDTAKSVKIIVQDSSNGATGFIVYRADGLSAPFQLVSQAVSADPLTQDSIFIYDSAMTINSWNIYKVAAYRNGDTLVSAPCTTYIYKDLGTRQIIKFTKLGNFAVDDTVGGWSALVGDSLYLKEAATPAGKFAVIDVADPAAPVAGTIDSTTLLNYPLNTLIPVFIKYGVKNAYGKGQKNVFNFQDKILISRGNNNGSTNGTTYTLLQINGSSLAPLDSFNVNFPSLGKYTGGILDFLRFNDSTFGVESYQNDWDEGGSNVILYFLPFKISSTRLIQYNNAEINGFAATSGNPVTTSFCFAICGLYNNKILMPDAAVATGSRIAIGVYDLLLDTLVSGGGSSFTDSALQNSSYYFNTTMYFSDDPPYVYATDVRDVAGRTTAAANNALISDTGYGARQNLFIDTARQLLFILYKTNLSIFRYATASTAVLAEPITAARTRAGMVVIPGSASSGVTIVLKGFSGPAELSFYDMSGRMVKKISGVTANAVRWRPNSRPMGCFIVCAKSSAEKCVTKFMTW